MYLRHTNRRNNFTFSNAPSSGTALLLILKVVAVVHMPLTFLSVRGLMVQRQISVIATYTVVFLLTMAAQIGMASLGR